MPQIQLKASLWLYSPLPGRQLYEVRNKLVSTGGRVVWHGKLASVKEYQARHWVDEQRNLQGGTGRGWRDYQVGERSMYEGKQSATDSLRSAVVAMLPSGADIEAAEVLVARLFA